VLDHAFLFGIAVEAGDGRQATTDGGSGPATGFELAGVQLDVAAAGVETDAAGTIRNT
jgi:hypothetical protein